VVTNAVETVQPQLSQKHHALKVFGAGDPLPVDGDPLRLQQVIVNLLDNASKYSSDGGLIEVRLRRTAEHAVISVRDFGIGIPPGMIERIFGLFEQGTSTSGLGIGLTLVRELVRMHGGTIQAQSGGENQGSEFIITLPLITRPLDAFTPLPERRLPARSGSDPARVLIVDDNRDAADLLGSALEELGHDVAIAYSADAALALMPGRDAALVDLAMPGMNGFELVPELRRIAPDAELFAVTGFGDDANRAHAAAAGFQHYALKPVELGDIDSLLRAAAGKRAS
jgi:CheY-like chemotaxis protein